jgi:hypothetical protein
MAEWYAGMISGGSITHLRSELWSTRLVILVILLPMSQKRDVGHPIILGVPELGHAPRWSYIPHLKIEMWGTRAFGDGQSWVRRRDGLTSHVSESRHGAPERFGMARVGSGAAMVLLPTSQNRDMGHPSIWGWPELGQASRWSYFPRLRIETWGTRAFWDGQTRD